MIGVTEITTLLPIETLPMSKQAFSFDPKQWYKGTWGVQGQIFEYVNLWMVGSQERSTKSNYLDPMQKNGFSKLGARGVF